MKYLRKVLIITTIPQTAKSFYLNTAKMLKNNGVEVHFAFSEGEDSVVIQNLGYEVKTLPISRYPFYPGNITSIFILASYLIHNKIGIIETTTAVASVVGRIAAIIARVPVRINTIRGMFPEDTHKYQSMLFNIFERLLYSSTTLTITINKEDRSRILSKGNRDPARVIVLPCGGCGVDFSRFNKDYFSRERVIRSRSELNINASSFVVTFIGRLTRDKGICDLIEIIKRLSCCIPDFKVLVVGDVHSGEHDGIRLTDLKDLIEKEGIKGRMIVAGRREDVPNIIALSDVVILPSYREGFGLVLAETAAMGKPAVAYKNSGSRDAVDNGITGMLVEKGDIDGAVNAIEKLANDSDYYNRMSENAFEKAKREYDVGFVTDEYKRIYTSFIDV